MFAGELPELHKMRFAMVRLGKPTYFPELMHAPLPTKFLFVIMGPHTHDVDYHEVGFGHERKIKSDLSEIAFLHILNMKHRTSFVNL